MLRPKNSACVLIPLVIVCALPAVAESAENEEAIEAGREALSGSGDYPWYDDTADDVRRIEVKPPKPPKRNVNTGLFSFGDWFTPLAWIGITLLMGLIIFVLVRAYLLRERRAAQATGDDDHDQFGEQVDRVEELPVRIRRPASDLLSEARRQYEDGNYSEAIIYYYSHQLVQLDRRQLIRLAKGKTNRQYLRELATRSGLFALLEQTMIIFEDVFFGRHKLQRERFETVWNRMNEFDQLLEQAAV